MGDTMWNDENEIMLEGNNDPSGIWAHNQRKASIQMHVQITKQINFTLVEHDSSSMKSNEYSSILIFIIYHLN